MHLHVGYTVGLLSLLSTSMLFSSVFMPSKACGLGPILY